MPDQLLGVFGGTFDPLHMGHIRTIKDVQQGLNLSEIRLIPNYIPAHRELPVLDAKQRYSLLEKALTGDQDLIADDCEINRQGVSYMVDTLRDLKQRFSQKHLCLIIGTDAYNGFCQWHEWQEILQLAHLIVMKRAGFETMRNNELDYLLSDDPECLMKSVSGKIYHMQVSQLDISSTKIREMIQKKQDIQFLVPENIRLDLQTLYEG